MKHRNSRAVGRMAAAVGAALMAVVLSAGGVLADTELGHKGKVGPHQTNDGPSNPVRCNYREEDGILLSMDIATVTIWSRDTSAGRDRRKVGWQVILERRPNTSFPWEVIHRNPLKKAPAWNDQSAFFETQHVTHEDVNFEGGEYRIVSKMLWYSQNGGNKIGAARHRHDNYLLVRGSTEIASANPSCPDIVAA
jgi:hypothetical protein